MPSHWETILKNTLEEIETEKKDVPWDIWLKENEPEAYEEYVAEINDACEEIQEAWMLHVALRKATAEIQRICNN